VGLFGTRVQLKDGSNVRADESYVRESVLYPQAKIVAGYDDIMPTFKGLITEDGLLKLIEYIKSLGAKNGTMSRATPGPVETSASPQPSTHAAVPGKMAQGKTAPRAVQGTPAAQPPRIQ
jgi:cytochrome c oxidase subunit 2